MVVIVMDMCSLPFHLSSETSHLKWGLQVFYSPVFSLKVLCKGERIETDQYLRFNKRMHKVTNLHVRIMRNKGCDFYEEQLLES